MFKKSFNKICILIFPIFLTTCLISEDKITNESLGDVSLGDISLGDISLGDEREICQTNDDCSLEEICDVISINGHSEGYCNDVNKYYFNVTVLKYIKDNCKSEQSENFIHFFEYKMDNKFQRGTYNSKTCPSSWENTKLFYDPNKTFKLDFRNIDGEKVTDTSFCFNNKTTNFKRTKNYKSENNDKVCLSIPKEILHDGYYLDDEIELLIEPIL